MVTTHTKMRLAPLTTIGLGGPTPALYEIHSEAELRETLATIGAPQRAFAVIGGGSNIVVADDGIDEPVIAIRMRGISRTNDGTSVEVTAAAGEPWDPFVATCVADGLAGIECLSGIPGLVGATPIQNVGAYGQQVSDSITQLRCYDVLQSKMVDLDATACGFGYRTSRFKREDRQRYIIVSVSYRLRKGAPDAPRYPQLKQALSSDPSLTEIRDTVLSLRRSKSMVIDREDPNHRSVGSFFLNPILSEAQCDQIELAAKQGGVIEREEQLPRFPLNSQERGEHAADAVKVPAAWLIERAGFRKGRRQGGVGLSTNHTLAIVNGGQGTTAEVVELARAISDAVFDQFAIRLVPEPVFLGFSQPPL